MKIDQDALTNTSVSIQSDEYGMRAYINSTRGRAQLESECPAEIVQQVYAVWGDTTTVAEPEIPPAPEPQPSETDILGQQVEALTLSGAEKDTLIQQLGREMVQAQLDIAALKGGAGT